MAAVVAHDLISVGGWWFSEQVEVVQGGFKTGPLGGSPVLIFIRFVAGHRRISNGGGKGVMKQKRNFQ